MRRAALNHAIEEWHRIVRERDIDALDDLLADDVVFHSPVVHTPQRGRPITAMYLAAAVVVFGNETFRYLRECRATNEAVLEFLVTIDMIRWNDAGRIVDFKVMLRPLKAMNLIHQKMGAMLQAR
jgi:hypothetical protein